MGFTFYLIDLKSYSSHYYLYYTTIFTSSEDLFFCIMYVAIHSTVFMRISRTRTKYKPDIMEIKYVLATCLLEDIIYVILYTYVSKMAKSFWVFRREFLDPLRLFFTLFTGFYNQMKRLSGDRFYVMASSLNYSLQLGKKIFHDSSSHCQSRRQCSSRLRMNHVQPLSQPCTTTISECFNTN